MTINLDTLRKIAENEPSHKWGKWTAEEDDWEGFVVFANDGLPGQSVVANGIRQGHDEGKATATHIATFDPPTVLALLSSLEQAEQHLDAALEANKRWAHRSSRERSELFKAEQNRVKLRNRLDAMRRQRDAYQNQLRKTEQQVQRVREIAETSDDKYLTLAILEALDGDTRADV